MRLYRNLVAAAVKALTEIFNNGQLADRVVQRTLRSNPKWGGKDRRFIANIVYEVVRWYRRYYEALGHEPKNERDWWHLLAAKWWIAGEDLPEWEEFESLDKAKIVSNYEEKQTVRAINASIPDWLDALGMAELGEAWEATLRASNKQAQLMLRVNTLKANSHQLVEAIEKAGNEVLHHTAPPVVDGLILAKKQKLTHLPIYKKGWFEVQDFSSQMVGEYLAPQAGQLVIDACAGAGGKSLHLAALMGNKGKIIAMDIRGLDELQKRAKRAGATIIQVQRIKDLFTIQDWNNKADCLLLDVPCSGLGTLKRSPHIKWTLTADFVAEIRATQQEILQNYSQMCKVGGKMVYATCSILPSENEEQVAQFLATEAGAGFELIKQQAILPQEGIGDGFFMALLERKV